MSRADLGQLAAANVPPKRWMREFKVSKFKALLPIGTVFEPLWFTVGQKVDVRATSKGKGFAGVMKRWGFHGAPASHGTTLTHWAPGSIGQSRNPGRVLSGKNGRPNGWFKFFG